ncbi:protein tyrosine phosphatase [Gregarina niphandrodes]|uniref:Protein tyrosine phosphatase n=1 Tax=Gregarina niphandrodes TaxID=110365 RepID=A0A023B8Q3_GRENI|nr:protein tyrosine phosphatase [Gregarina niphandrodes]EZG69597.1 protein tyrosine phosphatase [Gregarina niphandrodes]|eukprot:XP_011129991.1 protein tyrosine phosphatase [Gregarina niphandrodes]
MEPYWNGYKSSECTIEKVRELDAVVGVERHLRVTCHNLDGKLKRRAVIQLHYDDWLDHTTPDPKKFKALVRDVAPFCCAEKPRVIVHCSAGVGRTGTLISALRCHLIRKAELANKWTPTNRAPTNRASTNPPSRSNDISTSREEEEPLYRPIGRWVDAAAAVMTAAEATTVQTPSLMQLVFESVAIAKEQRFLSVESKEQFEFLTTLSFP